MRIVASLCLCLAGSSAAVPAGAFDRDRLASEAPMEPCPAQGPNFAKIPGTSTCIRLSGRVAAGIDVGRAPGQAATPPNAVRAQIDTRSTSDYGPVRSVVRMGAER